jgi:1,2-diacylglycerol-3-alpha-glucose alpha-1,2-galactosyltransferase
MKVKNMMTINVCSETEIFNIHSDGVSTSFIDCINLLKRSKGIKVFANSEGVGDIFHCHTWGPYYFWRGLRYKGRRIYTAHVIPDTIKGSFPFWKLLMPFTKWYFKKIIRYADVCIAISPTVEQVIKDLGTKAKVVRLDNPLVIERWRRTPELRKKGRKLLGLKDEDFCVLGVGQLQNRKGCCDFIEVGKQIPDAQFRWVGGRPFKYFNDGNHKIDHDIANASENIKFAGVFAHEEMAAIYAAGDLFLFPSYQENCPLAPIEAAASGMPVIFRNSKEYKSLYLHDYYKANNNEQFAEMINELMKNKEEYKKGLKISEALISQFDSNEIRKKLINIYKSLFNN